MGSVASVRVNWKASNLDISSVVGGVSVAACAAALNTVCRAQLSVPYAGACYALGKTAQQGLLRLGLSPSIRPNAAPVTNGTREVAATIAQSLDVVKAIGIGFCDDAVVLSLGTGLMWCAGYSPHKAVDAVIAAACADLLWPVAVKKMCAWGLALEAFADHLDPNRSARVLDRKIDGEAVLGLPAEGCPRLVQLARVNDLVQNPAEGGAGPFRLTTPVSSELCFALPSGQEGTDLLTYQQDTLVAVVKDKKCPQLKVQACNPRTRQLGPGIQCSIGATNFTLGASRLYGISDNGIATVNLNNLSRRDSSSVDWCKPTKLVAGEAFIAWVASRRWLSGEHLLVQEVEPDNVGRPFKVLQRVPRGQQFFAIAASGNELAAVAGARGNRHLSVYVWPECTESWRINLTEAPSHDFWPDVHLKMSSNYIAYAQQQRQREAEAIRVWHKPSKTEIYQIHRDSLCRDFCLTDQVLVRQEGAAHKYPTSITVHKTATGEVAYSTGKVGWTQNVEPLDEARQKLRHRHWLPRTLLMLHSLAVTPWTRPSTVVAMAAIDDTVYTVDAEGTVRRWAHIENRDTMASTR